MINNNVSHISPLSLLSVPPSLANQPTEGQLVVKKGSTVTLKCQASGFPTPQVRNAEFKCKNYKILLSMLCVKLAYLSL